MRVLVLGSGGREHALAWAIGKSPLVEEVLCAPGSDGIAQDARVLAADPRDSRALVELVKREGVSLVVVGPEDLLAAGVADRLREAGISVFGPGASAARLESSKRFAKEFMARHGIPTAAHASFATAEAAEAHVRALAGPCVVKADGLAAGKGVFVCDEPEAALAALHEVMRARRFGASGAEVVIEERLVGPEASFYALCDGERFAVLPHAQDHKRVVRRRPRREHRRHGRVLARAADRRADGARDRGADRACPPSRGCAPKGSTTAARSSSGSCSRRAARR